MSIMYKIKNILTEVICCQIEMEDYLENESEFKTVKLYSENENETIRDSS